MGKTLVVTSDFPPRRGGIEAFVYSLCSGLPADELVVYTASMPGSAHVDGAVAFPVIRDEARRLLPTPRLARAVQQVARHQGCDRVLFGASAPLGLLARGLRQAAGVRRIVGLTHGHEVWWSRTPTARALLRRVGDDVDVLTYVSEYCHREISLALSPAAAGRMVRLAPGVDTTRFHPDADGSAIRKRAGIGSDRPVVLAASRLVARKGHDVLIEAWSSVRRRHPDAVLLVVGDGPARRRLAGRVRQRRLGESVRFLPSVSWAEMPAVYAAADVFALPCRTRLGGLEPEALGIVFLEAAATGLPVVVGSSGGAPETVDDGHTGYVVAPRSPHDVAERINALLDAPVEAAAMGRCGRQRVRERWTVDAGVHTLQDLLA